MIVVFPRNGKHILPYFLLDARLMTEYPRDRGGGYSRKSGYFLYFHENTSFSVSYLQYILIF